MKERDYFKQPFTRAEIEGLLEGQSAAEMLNPRSPRAKELHVNVAEMTDEQLVELMLKEPRLIRRPIVRIADGVYYGASEAVLREVLK